MTNKQKERQMETGRKAGEKTVRPELTRDEYIRLLSAAKVLGKERLYFIIKLFACTGIKLPQLLRLTVEEVRAGEHAHSWSAEFIPDVLRRELLDYAKRRNIESGRLFCTRTGTEIDRSNLCHEIQELAEAADVDAEKCNPRCLIYLYRNTQKDIQDGLLDQIRKANEEILEREQEMIGWEQ